MKLLSLFVSLYLFSNTAIAQKEEYVFQLDVYKNHPMMYVATMKTFACSNYGIFIRQGWSRDTLTMNIIGIDSRQKCNNIVDVAKEWVPINGVRSGQFHLRFLWERKVNYFLVEFDGDSFSVTPERGDFIMHTSN